MRVKILLFLFFVTASIVQAQNAVLLPGKWVFKDVLDKSKMNEQGLKMLQSDIINKMTFTFIENGKFEAYCMGQQMAGTWVLAFDGKKIVLTTKELGISELTILELTQTRLGLQLGLGKFLMARKTN